ncbi:1-acyl-sn-glycerol-3-phosphate acyltransferase [Amycolatopsis bartoniae]|uniref:Phospholipid/glycerol acyltransferase domain-containing protein n=1 Tax=Amycolatopsis bartoniae TaxID=941986 RepID=A0A8H9J0A0_9PSEU|nr:1-acyl-sn-glycerol-3-phosphate acyltransferase [Amycolatopsis bartoniae]GHF72846.1 hypothetical protein GCM10017566_53440 [Amycolatopsis bartoniae]
MRRWRDVASALTRGGDLRSRARRLLTDLGVDLASDTDRLGVPGRGTLIVANHVSWLDVVAALAVEPTAFLAKREVGRWPVVSSLARRCGSRFIDRDELRGLPEVVAGLADTLRSGHSVVVFPEGTTWCGRCGSGTFRRAAFQAAIDAAAPIRPVTFEYRQGAEPSTVAAFVGEDTLLASLRRVVRASDVQVRVEAHPAFEPDGDRRELAARAEAAVRRAAHV